ncbi:MAG: 3-phosphoshikimate 1-carboxyvinyltransferase [Chloroflexi bacterium]|nr:3-phosphoshikimate 1-carboxyvinyltransferase [Chloroflexota bacterium]
MSAPAAPTQAARVERAARLSGTIEVPGDKSISHRGALMNALAHGRAVVENYSTGADCSSTLDCLRNLGVPTAVEQIEGRRGPRVVIDGLGGRLVEAWCPLDAGNSGTTMRLMAGVLAGQPIFSVLTGDASLSRRPMARVVEPLRLMGARIAGREGGRLAPFAIDGGGLKGIEYTSPVASAQVKSCLLLAGVQATGVTVAKAPAASRDHTERLLAAQGARVEVDGSTVAVHGGAQLQAVDVDVPGDASSAAYWLALGCAHPDAVVTVQNVGMNPGRTGFLDILREMGGDVEIGNERVVAGEPRADLTARSSRLRGVAVGGDLVPRAIDELPLVAVLGLFAEGVTEICDASELRVKESDRIASLARELQRLGGQVEELADGLRIVGGRTLAPARCEPYGDHRLAMSLAIAGLAGPGLEIDDPACASISYPSFWDDARALGATVSGVEAAWA